jgi:hypothetical protein
MKFKKPTQLESLMEKLNNYRIWLVATRCQIPKPGYHLDLSPEKIENAKNLLTEIETRSADLLAEIGNSGLDCGEIGSMLELLVDRPGTIFDVPSRVLCGALDPDDLKPEMRCEKEVA